MSKSANIYRDIALMALSADMERWTECGTLEAIAQFAWTQLQYRVGTQRLQDLLDEFAADLTGADPAGDLSSSEAA